MKTSHFILLFLVASGSIAAINSRTSVNSISNIEVVEGAPPSQDSNLVYDVDSTDDYYADLSGVEIVERTATHKIIKSKFKPVDNDDSDDEDNTQTHYYIKSNSVTSYENKNNEISHVDFDEQETAASESVSYRLSAAPTDSASNQPASSVNNGRRSNPQRALVPGQAENNQQQNQAEQSYNYDELGNVVEQNTDKFVCANQLYMGGGAYEINMLKKMGCPKPKNYTGAW